MSNQKRIEKAYAQVPEMFDCRGLCHDSCGPIPLTNRELQTIRNRGIEITPVGQALEEVKENPDWRCPALGENNLCSVYDVRPLICRLYGTIHEVKQMRCPHGCVPKRWLSSDEAKELTQIVLDAGGGQAPMF